MTNRTAYIGLGSNQGFAGRGSARLVRLAADALGALGAEVTLSPLYRSPAWPDPSQPAYTNAAARLSTPLSARALLAGLQAVEAGFGRVRSGDPALRYAPRTLDLDLLAMGEEVHASEELTLPHPRIAERDFVLLPLRDLAPDWRHPVTGLTPDQMLARLDAVTAERL